jgi:signal transduction histidine kinase
VSARPGSRGALRPSLYLLGATSLLLAGVELALLLATPGVSPLSTWLFTGAGVVYVGAGLIALSRRPSNRLGIVMVAGGLSLFTADLGSLANPVLAAVGTVAASVPLAVVVHLVLAFPSGRLQPPARLIVIVGYLLCLLGQAPLYLFVPPQSPADLLFLADRPDLAAWGATAQAAVGVVVMASTAALLIRQLGRADPARRRVMAPLYAYSVLAVLFVPFAYNLLPPLLGLSLDAVGTLQVLGLAGIPVAFAFGVLRGGFARTGEIEELGAWLGTQGGLRPELTAALARTLGDESLRLVFWVPERAEFVDASGHAAAMPDADSRWAAVAVELAERRVGAIVYDATLLADPELVRAAGRVVAIAVDHERLTAELRAREEELLRSRARLVEAADEERRRLARTLHDTFQVRLVLLAMDAQQLARDVPDAAGSAVALRAGIDDAAAELRSFVHTVMPAALIERGLASAVEDLLDRVPLRTRLKLDVVDGDLPPALETTAYCVVAEGLSNALKHAGAREVDVRVTHVRDRLTVEVRDDGMGGADTRRGSGLAGLRDRVDTLGGRLVVTSPDACGTTLIAELPCGS